jgi:hypothetical protein
MEVTPMSQTVRDPLPNGTYAVPDPDKPGIITLWLVRAGNLSAWPRDQRWAPFPPRAPEGLTREEKAAWRQDWYDDVYFPWKDRVIAAIAADPELASRRFDDLVTESERPGPDDFRPRRRKPSPSYRSSGIFPSSGKKRKRDKEAEQAFRAATLADAGMPVRRVADILEISRMTAWRRIQDGRAEHAELLRRMHMMKRGGPFVMKREGSDAQTS